MGGIVVDHMSVAPFHICPTMVSSHADIMISICTFIREEKKTQCQRLLYAEHHTMEELLSFLLLE
eukprot:scaffold8419_cov62-Attheya_sp.AAC.9